jgi:7-cyano-7-deazaguanine synthase
VENRNGIFLNIAAAFALSAGGSVVIAGFNREEAEEFPDNSREYIRAVNRALEVGEIHDIRVESPTAGMDKASIVKEGLRLGIPWDLLWSCYEGGRLMCGTCPSCSRLRAALEEQGVRDRIIFAGEKDE